MVPLAQIPPYLMKQVLILDGWKLRREDEFNWLLSKGHTCLPIRKKCKTLPFAVMDICFEVADLRGQRYLDLLAQAARCRLSRRCGFNPASSKATSSLATTTRPSSDAQAKATFT